MPDGDFRRPPRLWEEQLQATIDVQSVGISSLAASTVPTVTMPDPGGVAADPAPPAYADIATAPAAPTLVGIIAGLNVTWTGLDVSSNAYPAGMYAEVHVSATSGFTPSSGTLKATLSRPDTATVTGLTAGTTYYAKVIVIDEQGQRSPASAQASLAAGFITSGVYGTASIDYGSVSFNARDIGGITTTVGSTTPTSPKTGDIWLDSSALSASVTSATGDGTIIVYTSAHPFAVGDSVTVAGTSGASFNRTGTVSAATATTFTFTAAVTGTATGGTATGPVRGVVHKRYDGSAWVAQAWGPDTLAANTITAKQIAAAAITAGAIAAGAITAEKIDADAINGKTITGSTVRTSSGTARVEMTTGGLSAYNSSGVKTFDVNASTGAVTIASGVTIGGYQPAGSYATTSDISGFITGSQVNANVTSISGSSITTGTINADLIKSGTITGRTIQTSSNGTRIQLANSDALEFWVSGTKYIDVTPVYNGTAYVVNFSRGIDISSGGLYVYGAITSDYLKANTATLIPNLRCGTDGIIQKTSHVNSAQRFKHDIVPLNDTPLADAVDASLLGTAATVDPMDVLTLTPVQFRWNETNLQAAGFIAEDVEAKFPVAAMYDEDGEIEAVDVRPLVSALLAVVQSQQAQIADLITRVEALEA